MIGVALVGLGALIYGIDAHPLVVTIFALLIAPAVWDVIKGSVATLRVDDTGIEWQSGARARRVAFDEIDTAILSTSLDFSQRATLQLKNGQKQRVPFECLPGGRVLDEAFEARGIPHRRSLFSF